MIGPFFYICQMQKKILIYCPNITSRHKYIFHVLFKQLYVINYEITDDKELFIHSDDIKINYSKNSICNEEVFIKSCGLLCQKRINSIDIKVKIVFNEPAFFTNEDSNSYPFDLFSAIFYLITRYEE